MERHVLHSLGIAKVMRFQPARACSTSAQAAVSRVALAVLHPETEFVLCDSIGKKIKVVEAARKPLAEECEAIHARVSRSRQFDFVVSGR